jgi:hypothetical protein
LLASITTDLPPECLLDLLDLLAFLGIVSELIN